MEKGKVPKLYPLITFFSEALSSSACPRQRLVALKSMALRANQWDFNLNQFQAVASSSGETVKTKMEGNCGHIQVPPYSVDSKTEDAGLN